MFLCDRTMFCLANGPLPLMSCLYYKFDVIYTYGFYGNNTWPVPTFVFLIHWSLLLRQTSCSQIGVISWHTPWQNINLFVKSVRTVCNYRFCWQLCSQCQLCGVVALRLSTAVVADSFLCNRLQRCRKRCARQNLVEKMIAQTNSYIIVKK